MAAISLFMIWYGVSLAQKTFFQSYPGFQYIRVGAVFSTIPAGGLITLLFVIEKALGVAPPRNRSSPRRRRRCVGRQAVGAGSGARPGTVGDSLTWSSCAATATAISPGCLPETPGMPIGQTMRSIAS